VTDPERNHVLQRIDELERSARRWRVVALVALALLFAAGVALLFAVYLLVNAPRGGQPGGGPDDAPGGLRPELPGRAEELDRQELQGQWALSAGEDTGTPLSADVVKGSALSFAGDTYALRAGTDVASGRYRLSPFERPRQITLTGAGGERRGIYKLDRGQLTLCLADPGQEPPREFTTRSGTGRRLYVWRRGGPP
jgi:uncharacterized protein (TIGR03067 family)